jgi:hypothetical protein
MNESSETYSIHNYLARRENLPTPKTAAKKMGGMSVLANRLISQVASKLDQITVASPDEFPKIAIDLSDFHRGGKSIYDDIETACEELKDRPARFIHPETQHLVSTRWMATSEYTGNGRVLCRFSPELMPVLLELKAFRTDVNLTSFMALTSSHSQRLYEIASSFKSLGEWAWTIDQIRSAFELAPLAYRKIDDPQFRGSKKAKRTKKLPTDPTDWGNFKRRVLDEPIAVINELTDMRIEISKDNKGKRWDRVRFTVTSQIKKAKGASSSTTPKAELPEWHKWWLEAVATDEGQDLVWQCAIEAGIYDKYIVVDSEYVLNLRDGRDLSVYWNPKHPKSADTIQLMYNVTRQTEMPI